MQLGGACVTAAVFYHAVSLLLTRFFNRRIRNYVHCSISAIDKIFQQKNS